MPRYSTRWNLDPNQKAEQGEARRIAANVAKLPEHAAVRCSRLTVALLSLTGRTKPLQFPFRGWPVAVLVVIPCAGLPAAAILAD
jgi:hypothetical protein